MRDTYWPDSNLVECPFVGSIAVNNGDLMWSDKDGLLNTGKAYPATSMNTQGSNTANFAYFAPRFLGVARETLQATQVRDRILVDRVWIGPITIDSGTYYQGDMLTAKGNAGGTGLVNQQVTKTLTVAEQIGFVFRDPGASAVTTITACLISNMLPRSNVASLLAALNTAGFTMDDAANIAFNTSTGTKIGTATGQKLAFWNSTPIAQPSGAGQAAASMTAAATTATVGAALSATISGSAINTAQGTNSSSWGFNTQANFNTAISQLNAAAVDIAALNTQINLLRTDVLAINTQIGALNTDTHGLNTLANAIRSALVPTTGSGLMKGSA